MSGRRVGLALVVLLAGILSPLVFIACSKSPSDPQPPVARGDVLADTTIDASSAEVTVTVPGAITVVVPAGAAPANSRLRIVRPYPEDVPADDLITPRDVFDVTLGAATEFAAPLRVTMPFDPADMPDPWVPGMIGAAWYNEALGRWNVYADAAVDTTAHTVTFETSHLTKLSRWSISSYTDWRSSLHFNVYWIATGPDAPVSDAVYGHRPAWHVSDDPDYIQDLASFLEDAYLKYESLGLTVHSGKLNVYVHRMKENGETKYLGYINVSSKVEGIVSSRPTWEELQSTAAHEYLHYVQDYYYVGLMSQYTTMWWWEATATQADRMVWPTRTWFEAEDYADRQVDTYLHKSWDDCQGDPDWYVAGGFLAWLANYRTGTKADIAELVRRGGETGVSYIRTVVDDYLKTELGSAGIGREYAHYLVWAYEGRGAIGMLRPNISTTPLAADIQAELRNDAPTKAASPSMPHLSGRILKMQMGETTPLAHTLKIVGTDLPTGVDAYIYAVRNGSATFLSSLASGQTKEYRLKKGTGLGEERIDVLLVNTDKDKALTPRVDVSIDPHGTGSMNLDQKIDGRVLGVHGNQINVRTLGVMTGPGDVAVSGTEQAADDFMFEYPTRTLTVLVTPGAAAGVMENFSVRFTDPRDAVVDSLATAGWKWEWLGYTGGRLTLLNTDTGEWEHPDFTGNSTSASGRYMVSQLEAICSARTRYSWKDATGQVQSGERTCNFKLNIKAR